MMLPPGQKLIKPLKPGLLNPEELTDYLNVGRNDVPAIARRFGLLVLEGLYVETVIWRQIHGLEPADDEAADLLRHQLQGIRWVAGRVGRAPSTIRNRIRAGTFNYPCGVQLGHDAPDRRAPRTRRWLPEVIEAARAGRPLQQLRSVKPIPVETDLPAASRPSCRREKEAGEDCSDPDQNNILAQIVGDNARPSRQRWK